MEDLADLDAPNVEEAGLVGIDGHRAAETAPGIVMQPDLIADLKINATQLGRRSVPSPPGQSECRYLSSQREIVLIWDLAGGGWRQRDSVRATINLHATDERNGLGSALALRTIPTRASSAAADARRHTDLTTDGRHHSGTTLAFVKKVSQNRTLGISGWNNDLDFS